MAIDYEALLEGAENIRIGPCLATWGGDELGLTQGGVTISVSVSAAPSEDIGLPRHYDHIVEEMDVTVTVPLAESSIAQIVAMFPWSSGLSLEDGSGKKLRQYAQELTLTPLDESAEIVKLPMAVPISEIKSKFTSKELRIVDVTFQALTKSSSDHRLIEFAEQGGEDAPAP
jgi:hypothetical protein